MGALGNIISGLFGGGAKKPSQPTVEQQDRSEIEAEATNNEHSETATALAKPEAQADNSTKYSSILKFVEKSAPASPEAFKELLDNDPKPFLTRLIEKTKMSGLTELADHINSTMKPSVIDSFQKLELAVESIKKFIKCELSPTEQSSSNNEENKNQAEELKGLEKELEGLASLLGGMEAAQSEAKPEEAKTEKEESPKATKTEDKPSPAKQETKKNEAGELDALLKQLTA